uniref:Cyclin-dependent kinase 2 homolog n=3 Tax=Odontella aurita TaxID=265563 RepID=A0A7S4JTD8_9STRA|mmetsp:Transcript_53580/g.160357  ORF Transcript_53580/g.160357 Transcript_53580/m.160357 type:complete len:397 (+) Transcript_53580:245-1435(+)|eukprot:CAMPEP_0113553070 /NCGR_PEP_ID=MMETSP0015_2-20120614/15411_1 /TAXON_ID=2838 /ORGANISM="Odontella" /LENGTH=396 /DNA_ID=CAMNT_0000454103 /DNA_START=49 /DNA_END=1239 /DNA_ORIENTATION=- /assembly_acc=CAM_ASM_000160
MSNRKRDRWDSSSDEEGAGGCVPVLAKRKASAKEGHVVALMPAEGVAQPTTAAESGAMKSELSPGISRLPKHNPLLSGCRSVYSCYERLARLDEGTYGVVWKARDTATDDTVALKQIKFDQAMMKEGFPITALREISVLLDLSHDCIVTVREMVVGDAADKVFMVMEFMEMDLQEAIKRSGQSPFPQSELKNMMFQVLSAMDHIHEKWYVHRDMKTSNILVHRSGKIALCDFGLARKYQMPLKALTQMVITLWYRPPELLFGEHMYGPEVDMWSVGCIFGELLKKDAMLQGRGELDQVDKIFKLIGTPDEESWPGFLSLPNARTFRWKPREGSQLSKEFPVNTFTGGQTYLDSNGLDLLTKLLTLSPRSRISASAALDHPYFKEGVGRQTPRFAFD